MTSSRLRPALLLAGSCLWTSTFLAADLQPFEAVEPHMGSLFRIKLYAGTEAEAQSGFRAAFARIAELDSALSDYKPESELSRLTAAPPGMPVRVSPDLLRVLEAGQALAAESDGAFDVTLGPLTHLWRQARRSGQLPLDSARAEALRKCGFRKLHLDRQRQCVTVDEAGMQLDVGGIAKGFAADEALHMLSRLGIQSALIAASGDLAFSDAPPGKPGWRVGVDALDEAGAPFTRVLLLHNAAVSTSGDSEQGLNAGGKRYSHLLDPKTGLGLSNRLTVTVVASHGIDADALTKVVSVWGREKGLAFIEHRPGAAALVVDRSVQPMQVSESRLFRGETLEREF